MITALRPAACRLRLLRTDLRTAGRAWLALLAGAALWAGAQAPEALLTPAFTLDQVELAGACVVAGERRQPLEPELARAILGGEAPKAGGLWHQLVRDLPPETPVRLLLPLAGPVRLGAVALAGAHLRLAAAAPLPNPLADQGWGPPVPPSALAPLPPGTQAVAVLLVMTTPNRGSLPLPRLAAYRQRLYNLAPQAIANAESEYTVKPDMGPPFTLSAAQLLAGRGKWQNTGPDKQNHDRIPRPPVSDVAPSWLVLSWPATATVAALQFRGNPEQVKLYTFTGAAGLNPAVGAEEDWRLVQTKPRRQPAGREETAWQLTFPPLTTRGLRLLILATSEGPIASLSSLQVIQDLGLEPVPAVATVADHSPFGVPYKLAEDRRVTLVVNDAQGRRVRNLIARRDRRAGAHAEPWDLKDEQGRYVSPGTYRLLGLSHQPLTMHYELTPFPNIAMHAPENAPWLTGHSGTGGWLADHSAIDAILAVGDRVFMGSPCAEGGVAMLEADLEGRKRWGHHNFMAWTGPQRFAANATDVFVHAWAENADHIWSVSLADHTTRELLTLPSTALRQQGIRGLAAHDQTLVWAVRGQDNWLANAFSDADVDLAHCLPRIAVPDKRDPHAIDPQRDWLTLFRLVGAPTGQRGTFTTLDSTKGPERRQHLVLACRKEVPLGTLVFPMPETPDLNVRFSVLKPGAAYPPDAEREADWLPLPGQAAPGAWAALPAPPNTTTRALRVSFSRGPEDDLTDVVDLGDGGAQKAWQASLEGLKLLRRRFAALPATRVRVSSGEVGPHGVWDARREAPLAPEAPAVYLLQWDQPQPVRGLAIKEIDGQETRIDVYTGDAGGDPALTGQDGWEEVATYLQRRRYYYQPDPDHNSEARYMDGYVDFGREITTRAVRLRIVSQWTTRAAGREGLYGVRKDRGGMDLQPNRCRVYGVTALRYLGDEPPVDPLLSQRLDEYDLAQRKVVREVALAQGGDLAYTPTGELLALSGTTIVRIDWAGGRHQPLVTDLVQPTCFALDAAGLLYAFDAAPDRRVVRVYDAAGKYLRSIGTPGGFQTGAWDPTRMGNVVDLTLDARGQLWLAENQHYPKRTTRWTAAGEFVAEYFDRTIYGGGGVLDPQDKSRLYYGPLEFALDWQSGATRLRYLNWLGKTPAGEQPVYAHGRQYLVTRESFFTQDVGNVYRYQDGVATLAAAIGLADRFAPLNRPDIRASLGNRTLADLQFVWSDRSGDGALQPDEVVFSPRTIRRVTNFDPQLGLTAGNRAWRVREVLPNGVPVYAETELPLPPDGQYYQLANGNYFAFGEAAVYTPTGECRWRYPTEGTGVHAYYRAKPLHPEQVVAEFSIVGHCTPRRGDLGEFLVTSSNSGIWHLWTIDGLLAGSLFRDLRDPLARTWSMPEHERGMRLPEVTAGQEHFWGHVSLQSDDSAYGIWMSTNVFRIGGLDSFQRFTADLTVTADDLRAAVAWDERRQHQQVYRQARVLVCAPAPQAVRVDGDDSEWAAVPATTLDPEGDRRNNATLRLSFGPQTLNLCYDVVGLGPFANPGEDFQQLFKSGAGVDLMLGTNPAAAPDRNGPVAGDRRILFAMLRGKPVAVLFDALVPGTPAEQQVEYKTMVFRTRFDRVVLLTGAQVATRPTEEGYRVEATLPLAELGLTPQAGQLLRCDWGVLRTDATGNAVLGRHYWANPATAILSDIAAEAALQPALWGHLRFAATAPAGNLPPAPGGDLLAPPGTKATGGTLDKLFNELEEENR
jgi:hypothetical protein